MERTIEYRGCRVDASVVAAKTGLKLSTVYQITPLTEQATRTFGGQWKRITKAGTKVIRDVDNSGGENPLHDAMELTLKLATKAIDDVFDDMQA